MKKVIITGVNSYIGNCIRVSLEKSSNYDVAMLSMRNDAWKQQESLSADTVIHCAGLVHQSEKDHSLEEYYRVNTELTAELARKAKADGVGLFVFISSISVYGTGSSCIKPICITKQTALNPKRKYSVSKLEAEHELLKLSDDKFRVSIIRAPFIYGAGCPGNYAGLRNFVLKYHFIPKLNNKYSTIYIENLVALIKGILDKKRDGVFTPQNLPVRCTWEMAHEIAVCHGKKVICTSIFNPAIKVASLFLKPLRSAFGSEYYEEKMSICPEIDYNIVPFEESIRKSER